MPTYTTPLEAEATEMGLMVSRLEYLLHDTALSQEAIIVLLANLSAKRSHAITAELGCDIYDVIKMFNDVFLAVLDACDDNTIETRCSCVMCRNIRATNEKRQGDSDALDS